MWVCLLSLWMQLDSISRRPSTPHYARFHVINKVVTEILELRLHNFTNHGYVPFFIQSMLYLFVYHKPALFFPACSLSLSSYICQNQFLTH